MSAASITPPLYLTPRTDVPVVIGRVVASLPALRTDEVVGLGRAREEAPPDWRERDIIITVVVITKRLLRTGMVENDKRLLRC